VFEMIRQHSLFSKRGTAAADVAPTAGVLCLSTVQRGRAVTKRSVNLEAMVL
jgi:hypothetical protein